jgi:hypothetical protein
MQHSARATKKSDMDLARLLRPIAKLMDQQRTTICRFLQFPKV